jgi:hypothetical protein
VTVKIPIQPFDDRLHERLFRAIIGAFEEQYQLQIKEIQRTGIERHEADYDPDTCGTAADRVIAVLVSELLGVEVTLAPQTIIGNGTLVIDTNKAPS